MPVLNGEVLRLLSFPLSSVVCSWSLERTGKKITEVPAHSSGRQQVVTSQELRVA